MLSSSENKIKGKGIIYVQLSSSSLGEIRLGRLLRLFKFLPSRTDPGYKKKKQRKETKKRNKEKKEKRKEIIL